MTGQQLSMFELLEPDDPLAGALRRGTYEGYRLRVFAMLTYEAIGPHFQGNPYGLTRDILVRHGVDEIDDLDDRSLEGIREYLTDYSIEGIVFWLDGVPRCKIKRTDFGLEWPISRIAD